MTPHHSFSCPRPDSIDVYNPVESIPGELKTREGWSPLDIRTVHATAGSWVG